ncbi:MAG: tRNA (adenosine(37)-N6)-threonylcarbamoyltransferase complex dimerization subunit type 1 TsaB [Dehalococcoidia bacterium]
MELSIDTASDWASIALSEEGRLRGEMTWLSKRQHSVQLLPAVRDLLARLGVEIGDLKAIFVCSGPGGYAGLRVGMSTAKGLAFALGLPIVGIGRLESEAFQYADCGGPVCAVHRAGRGEAGWAVYEGPRERWREVLAPRLSSLEELLREAPKGALFCGEEDDDIGEMLATAGGSVRLAPVRRRAGFLAELGWRRLAAGLVDDARTLSPLYLREPAIGPQKTVS